ncbi:hypothetical protein F4810DRAFT_83668 [Camillea tinctor]|nr:hypothetical protein F4810DRAFT_83668 [Camillea tinctor]
MRLLVLFLFYFLSVSQVSLYSFILRADQSAGIVSQQAGTCRGGAVARKGSLVVMGDRGQGGNKERSALGRGQGQGGEHMSSRKIPHLAEIRAVRGQLGRTEGEVSALQKLRLLYT